MGNRETACAATLVRGVIQRVLGHDASEDAYRALTDAADAGLRPLVPDALDLIAGLALDGGRLVVAARLHAASRRLREEMGCVPSPLAALLRGEDEPALAARLGAEELAVADEQGAVLTSEGAIAYATRSRGRRARPNSGWESLTPTERDVVKLAAAGLGNRAIGSQLLITEGTVRTHLRHVFSKLGMRTRAELAAAAARREYHVPSADR
jgi:DNA-binding CsgD family transcriptional regulator